VVFLSSQIYQFVLGYSPLAAGVRALPSAAALVVFSPVGAALAKRAGVRVPVTLGLAAVTAGLVIFSQASASSGYGHYVLAMVIVSAGVGLAMSAATSASMRELPPAMAGVGSAVNDTTRNMGSVLGVAVFGSIAASVFAGRMGGGSLGAVAAAAGGRPGSGADVLHAAASVFVTGADRAVLAGAIVAAGLVVAFRAFRPARATAPAEVPAEAAAEAPAEAAAEAPARVLETTGA
jgi:MFS family permease